MKVIKINWLYIIHMSETCFVGEVAFKLKIHYTTLLTFTLRNSNTYI